MIDKRSRPVFSKIKETNKSKLAKVPKLKKKYVLKPLKSKHIKLELKVWDINYGNGVIYHINGFHSEFYFGILFENGSKVFYNIAGVEKDILNQDSTLFRLKKK